MARFFPTALTVSVHLMLCALLTCVALFSPAIAGDTVGLSPGQNNVLVRSDAPVLAVSQATPYGTDAPSPMTPANQREPVTADVASDLPELLLMTALSVVPLLHADTPTRQPAHALPHPLLERPQRPPRPISDHA